MPAATEIRLRRELVPPGRLCCPNTPTTPRVQCGHGAYRGWFGGGPGGSSWPRSGWPTKPRSRSGGWSCRGALADGLPNPEAWRMPWRCRSVVEISAGGLRSLIGAPGFSSNGRVNLAAERALGIGSWLDAGSIGPPDRGQPPTAAHYPPDWRLPLKACGGPPEDPEFSLACSIFCTAK